MRRLTRPLLILLALVFLFETWLWEQLKPVVARLVSFIPWDMFKARVAAAIEHLPPYPTLLVFLVPVTLLLPLKFLGLWMLAHGFWLGAVAVLGLAKVVSLGVTAFIFELTRPKLLQLSWFRWLYQHILIWIEWAHPKHPCMCYHISPDWLREHGMNPQKAGAVEIANCKNFLKWTHEQPWMVLHELAHGYHHQVLGHDHKEIRDCYEQAKASKSYESVLHWDGRKVRAYALRNDQEYFAELTEAYFGTNDFYPFVRAELKQHDPAMFEILEKVWGGRNKGKE